MIHTKPIDVETFLDPKIIDLDERCAMWKYGVNAFQGNWTKVLAAKWVLASVSQGDIQSEVIRMKTVAYTPKMRDEILKNLKAYADELNNRYQVQSVPEFEPLLTLITVLDEKEYKPSVWSV